MAVSAKTKAIGRPSLFTQALADEIVRRLSDGEPLAHICKDDHMPTAATVWNWRGERRDFFEAITRAREIGHDAIATNARSVAAGLEGFSSGDVARDRLIIETDFKLLAKWDRRYGEKQQVEHTGTLAVEDRRTLDVRNLTPDQREQLRALIEAAQRPAIEGPVTDAEYEEVEGDE